MAVDGHTFARMSDKLVPGPVQGVIPTDGAGYPMGTLAHPLYVQYVGSPLIVTPASVAGAAITAAAETSMLPAGQLITLPANFFAVGRKLRIKASGLISSLITTPGTARFKVKLGPTANIAVFDSLAILLDTVVATVNAGWRLEIDLTCRSIGSGTAATLWGDGEFKSMDILGVPATPPKANAIALLPWAASPAAGTGFDSTIPNVLDLTFTQTAATGSITLEQYSVELVGG